ncbi:MAG: hypothetical protein GY866_41840 [Proteobacteria bacterium]|nr:hypothetical protein [Pseudomonadota bacterium]
MRTLIDLAVDHMELKEKNGFKAIESAIRGTLKKRSGLEASAAGDGGRTCKPLFPTYCIREPFAYNIRRASILEYSSMGRAY